MIYKCLSFKSAKGMALVRYLRRKRNRQIALELISVHPFATIALSTHLDELFLSTVNISRMGMQLPAAWQGMPGQPQIPAAAQQMAAAAQGAAMQQPGGMMAYPMQQFQVVL
jgi:hypothetical protein